MLNRRALYEDIDRAVHGEHISALLIVRVIRYRELASIFGYAIAERVDDALHDVVRRLLRPVDRVHAIGDGAMAVLLPDLHAPNHASLAAMRFASAFDEPLDVAGRQVLVTLATGIALAPEHGVAADDLCRHAEAACLQATRLFERFCIYTPDADALALSESELRTAIADNKLTLALQPVRDLRSDALVGAEALARWHAPDRNIPPTRFVALAEETGMIGALTQWSLNTALRYASKIGKSRSDLFVAINLSAHVLRQSDLVEQVLGALRIWDVAAERIVLELTETALMENPAHSSRVLSRLRDNGIHVAIDDFGTGYSSFSYLRQLPASELKIDQTFVSAVRDDPRVAQVVRSMISLAHHLDMIVIAEGVEDEATLGLLREMGCDMAQGFHIGVPVDADEFLESIAVGAIPPA